MVRRLLDWLRAFFISRPSALSLRLVIDGELKECAVLEVVGPYLVIDKSGRAALVQHSDAYSYQEYADTHAELCRRTYGNAVWEDGTAVDWQDGSDAPRFF